MKNSLGLPHSIGINYALRGNNSRANVIEISRWTFCGYKSAYKPALLATENVHSVQRDKSLTISEAMMSPATEGVKAEEPGTWRPAESACPPTIFFMGSSFA